MTNLPIHITTHHLSLSDALRHFARKKIASVVRFANDALAAEIVLRRHGAAATRFSASARLALPGRDVHGRAVDPNLYVAIAKLVTKLGRLLRKRKTRLSRSFTKSRPKRSVESPKLNPPLLLHDPPPRVGHQLTIRHREAGQEMRVFPFRRRLPFTLAPVHGVVSTSEGN